MGDGHDRRGNRRLATGKRQPGRAAVQRRQPLLQHIGGRVHQPRIDVAELFQGEQVGGVIGVTEYVTGRRVDRHRARVRGRVRFLAGMQRFGGQSIVGLGICHENVAPELRGRLP